MRLAIDNSLWQMPYSYIQFLASTKLFSDYVYMNDHLMLYIFVTL